jgi:hypothetical protein
MFINNKIMKKEYKPWYIKKWDKDNICGITQCRLRPGKDIYGKTYVITLPVCKHRFYRTAIFNLCVFNFPKIKIPCPICRHENEIESILNL